MLGRVTSENIIYRIVNAPIISYSEQFDNFLTLYSYDQTLKYISKQSININTGNPYTSLLHEVTSTLNNYHSV